MVIFQKTAALLIFIQLLSCGVNINEAELLGHWKVTRVTTDSDDPNSEKICKLETGKHFEFCLGGVLYYSDDLISMINKEGKGIWSSSSSELTLNYSYDLSFYNNPNSSDFTFGEDIVVEVIFQDDLEMRWIEKRGYGNFTFTLKKIKPFDFEAVEMDWSTESE